jgi:hypothetical protein
MKQQDIALIIVCVVVSAAIAIFVSKAIIVPPKNRQQQVQTVQPISTSFDLPDSKYYNSNSYDPSSSLSITQYNNTNPFNSPNSGQ